MAVTMLSLSALLWAHGHHLGEEEAAAVGAAAGIKDGEAHGTLGPAPARTSIEALICSYSWSCAEALRVARCESSLNPRAYSAGNRGIFQIHGPSHAHRVGGNLEALYDPATNVRVAHEIFLTQGWRPWPVCGRR